MSEAIGTVVGVAILLVVNALARLAIIVPFGLLMEGSL